MFLGPPAWIHWEYVYGNIRKFKTGGRSSDGERSMYLFSLTRQGLSAAVVQAPVVFAFDEKTDTVQYAV